MEESSDHHQKVIFQEEYARRSTNRFASNDGVASFGFPKL